MNTLLIKFVVAEMVYLKSSLQVNYGVVGGKLTICLCLENLARHNSHNFRATGCVLVS